jgi:N-methylhydantoinase A
MKMSTSRVAVDIGGTFTDLVAYSQAEDRLLFSKSLTTYDSLSRGVFDCVKLAGLNLADAEHFLHGSTIAINAVIQRRGARTGLIATGGFGDIYLIGRGNRPDAYNLLFEKAVPLVPRDLVAEVDERMNARGEILRPLDEDSVNKAIDLLVSRGVEAVAVVLLHAYRNPEHERRIRDAIAVRAPQLYVSLSHEVLREFREYERTSTTVLNAYLGPIVGRYVRDLGADLDDAGFKGNFLIMQSNGGTMSDDIALSKPVTMMESGPVAGVIASGRLGTALGMENVISFDMGGTTAKASLIENGETRIVTGYHIGGHETGHPMMLPVVDIVEVGTGGGSIAWIDAAGGLKVGPISAGSTPGPACYGKGGTEPTITDANLILGRLDAGNFLGGNMHLDFEAAKTKIQNKIAGPLKMNLEEAALGIIKIADTKMSLAVREVSVQKGHDPRGFALIASGGAGPLHASSIARELALPTVVIPELPGTFSALGMLMADVRHDYVRTLISELANIDPAVIAAEFAEMTEEAFELMKQSGIRPENIKLVRNMDLRYYGQEYTLTVSLGSGDIDKELLQAARNRFDELHAAQYSHSAPNESVEIVNLRLAAIGLLGGESRTFSARVEGAHPPSGKPKGKRIVHFDDGSHECPVYDRLDLPAGETLSGPLVIEEQVSTTIVHPGDRVRVSEQGPIVVEIGAS